MSDVANEPAAPAAAPAASGHEAAPSFVALALGSVGVVYGDIGTSPLYAFREAAIAASDGHPVTRGVVLGVLSLILWALIITVTLKYVLILLRADNNGEGGTLSLTALATRALGRRTAFIFIVGVIGASMFLGDSVITPAISVLSAMEGLKLASPTFSEYVAPLTVFILIGLFAAQSRGTAKVAALFGPIMVVWFVSIAIAGALHIIDDPARARRHQSALRHRIPGRSRRHRPGHAGRGVPGGDRRRGALRRPRPFRPQADPDRLARAWCCRRC